MQLALRISGTKQRMAGFAPLVNIGMLPEEIGANMDRVPAFSESPAFILRHSRDFICYLLLDRNVKSFDADANGVLSIALAISRDARLAGGQSPYSLLMRVYETFRSHYMSPQGDGRYSYINQDIDDTVFREIVREYPLEARKGPYVQMRDVGSPGIISLPPSQMEAFFRDTQYDEFKAFREIQVGTKCPTTPGLEALEIPLKPKFTVYLNGRPASVVLKEPYERFKVQGSVKEDFEYAGTEFSLQDVLDAPDGVISREEATIRLDLNENKIYCDLNKKEIWYNLVIELPVNEDKRRYLKEGAMRGDYTLYFGQENITSQIVNPTQILFKASSCKMNLPRLGGRTRDSIFIISASKQLSSSDREVKILLNATPVPKPVPQHNPSAHRADDRFGVSRMHDDEEEPEDRYPKKRKGLDIKSLLLGCIAGLCLGVLTMFLLAKLLQFKRVSGDEKIINESELETLKTKADSLERSNKDLLRKLGQQESEEESVVSQNKSGRAAQSNPDVKGNNPTVTETPSASKELTEEHVTAIMEAVKERKPNSYVFVSNMPGFRSLDREMKNGINWLLNTKNNCSKNDNNGKFKGDPNVDHDPNKANEIRQLTDNFYKNGVITLESIKAYYNDLVGILKRSN